MEVEIDETEIKAAGGTALTDGRRGLRIRGWKIETFKRSILTSLELQLYLFDIFDTLSVVSDTEAIVIGEPVWEEKLKTTHFPEMIFGNSSLTLKHLASGTNIHFNAYDALIGWKKEALPPVEVPAAAKWKFRSQPFQQVMLDYDYTFTTPYNGSEKVDSNSEKIGGDSSDGGPSLCWEDCEEKIDMVALASKEPILFYDEVVLYEDELADNGVSLLTAKVRVMPSGWFVLLRFWLRVDGVLMRLRDTRLHCVFGEHSFPVVLREICWRECTFSALAAKGYPVDVTSYNDPSIISERLPIIMHKTQKLIFSTKTTNL